MFPDPLSPLGYSLVVADATMLIPDGAIVTVDGNSGTVTVVALAPAV